MANITLTLEVEWTIFAFHRYSDGNQDTGYVFGTEYVVGSYSGYPFRRNLHYHEAPCVVCYVKSRGSILMMPARNDRPSGWTEEYHGYLMTAYYGHNNQKDFVCVDKDPEYVPGSQDNKKVPYCTTLKGNVELSLAFPTLITESWHALFAPSENRKLKLRLVQGGQHRKKRLNKSFKIKIST